jgi:hypothetical protein
MVKLKRNKRLASTKKRVGTFTGESFEGPNGMAVEL